MKKIFVGMSSWSQLFFLLLLSFFGILVSSIFVYGIAFFFMEGNSMPDIMELMNSSVSFLRVSQVVQQFFLFFVPACLCAYLFHKNSIGYLKINRLPGIDKVLLSVFLIFIVQPLISCTSYYNSRIRLPDFMSGIEEWMKQTEANATVITERMLSGNSIETLIINLIIVAVVAAIAEEFFFRGILQQIFGKILNNYHLAVWVTAFIFSAIHMQFYGFFPRLILGALLGYLFVYTGSLWIPILVHFINNATAVLLHYFYNGTPQYEAIENMGANDMWWTGLISLLLTTLVLYYLAKYHRAKPKNIYF